VMGLVRTVLFFLMMLVLARALMRFLGGVMQGARGGRHPGTGPASPPATRMVQDPVCGTYVVPGKAIEVTRGRDTTFFCSEVCRRKFLERT
jgi:YHS domain-containing protein